MSVALSFCLIFEVNIHSTTYKMLSAVLRQQDYHEVGISIRGVAEVDTRQPTIFVLSYDQQE